jgi:hypothetical protein
MRSFRLRLRAMLWLVAIAGVLSWGGIRVVPWARLMMAKSAEYREMADFLHSNQRLDLRTAERLEQEAEALKGRAALEKGDLMNQAEQRMRDAAYHRTRMVPYHAELEECYRQGASRPWNPLPKFPEVPPKE